MTEPGWPSLALVRARNRNISWQSTPPTAWNTWGLHLQPVRQPPPDCYPWGSWQDGSCRSIALEPSLPGTETAS
ncbi:hypothetical protein M5E87_23865 [Flavonifractor plautii]|nr:hypothetical protein M5E87_23865 [Flavonifractor plautii]